MAVDTRQKRMSMISFGDGVINHVLFEADGSVDADDRAHLLGLYSGIALAVPSAGVPIELQRIIIPVRLFRRRPAANSARSIITRLASLEVLFPLSFNDTEDAVVLTTQKADADSLTTNDDDIVLRTEVP